MNDETEAWHLADIEECRDSSYREPYVYKGERYRVKRLDNSIETPKRRNAKARVGDKCRCPMCGKLFTKKSYQQKFCCIICKNKYHNKRQVYY